MSDFLETLKRRMQEAQQKFEAVHKKFTATQTEFQALQQRLTKEQSEFAAAAQEFQAFQTLVNLETRTQEAASGALESTSTALPATSNLNRAVTPSQSDSAANGNKSEANKTQAVRDLLRQHPAGMTPAEIWTELETQLSNRAYLYSVLKRLRDKGDARERRGKYFFVAKIEENHGQTLVQ